MDNIGADTRYDMKQIRDQVHYYIPISPLEIALLRQPEILRLHRILQNSTLFYTYPSNRASRFSHSIGAMHIAGQLFKFLIYNSDNEFVEKLHSTVRSFIRNLGYFDDLKNCRTYLIEAYENSGGKKEFFLNQAWSMRGENARKESSNRNEDFHLYYTTVNNILFQAIRLAALVHDIGHPPFSHVLEFALSDLCSETSGGIRNKEVFNSLEKLKKKYLGVIAKRTIALNATDEDAQKMGVKTGPIHEMVGIVLIDEIFINQEKIHSSYTLENEFWRVCLQIAIRIISADQLPPLDDSFYKLAFDVEKDRLDLLDWFLLGNLINGQVDCDRIDYLLRDPINSGVKELGSFDYMRIISNIMAIKQKYIFGEPPENKSKDYYVPGFDRRALSALTDFFHDRLRQYRWMTNHHNVVRTDMALTRLMLSLVDIQDNDDDSTRDLRNYLEEHSLKRLWDWDDLTDKFRYVDDAWLDTLLQGLYYNLLSRIDRLSQNEADCFYYLQVLYDRNKDYMKPVWKRIDGFLPFAEGFKEEFEKCQNEKALKLSFPILKKPTDIEEKKPPENSDESETIAFVNQVLLIWRKSNANLSSYSVMERIEKKLAEKIKNDDEQNRRFKGASFVFALKSVTPYKTVLVDLGEQKIDLSRISSLVANLINISDKELKLYAYEISESFTIGRHRNTKRHERDYETKKELGKMVASIMYFEFRQVEDLTLKK